MVGRSLVGRDRSPCEQSGSAPKDFDASSTLALTKKYVVNTSRFSVRETREEEKN